MARHGFGQSIADYAIADDGSGGVQLFAAGVVTFWDSQTDGSQYTDLALDAGGMTPVSSVATEDGTGSLARGTWPIVYGPDGVTQMWASVNSGPRQLVVTNELADIVDSAVSDGFAGNYEAQGDLVAGGSGGEPTRVPVGADGTVLTADSGSSSGVSWQNPAESTIADGSISTAKLADGAVTSAKWSAADFNTGVRANRLDQMAAPTAAVAMNSQKITGLANGASSGDAVTKGQLDAKADAASPTFTGTMTIPAASVTGQFAAPSDALTDGATITTDASLGNYFRVTLGGNRTLANPTNPTDGQTVTWEIIQDATGSRTLSYGSKFAFGTDLTGATLTTTASKRDFLTARYNSTADKWFVLGFLKGY